ncbi:glycoside hydrolase family 32 protein [Aeribacillus composti]|jgi:beta-fructofuranosidase|uniref:glycoside hydrolase family 32 protein n=1 Tax=Aeribacillus composti TaxID=1868734 RepID=UPI002E235E53|nr:glycoside hydrolase family 32 protein [Aeribacillus composti]MED0747356.1 glycoside hydrolase family 32 protein [Aeribacillus composti]
MLTQNRVQQAEEALQNAKRKMDGRYRLGYHIMAPANWINDPNGLIQYKGEYHVFYQHHPYDENWGPMHWGHVKSKDLIHWEHLPIALAPTETYEKDGCFSGSAVDDNGVLTLIYTGNIFVDREKDIVDQSQCIATSTDGIHFTKETENPVILKHPEEGSGHFRDPKVWKHEGHWYMVLGTRKEDIGKVVLYKSKDLRQWEYLGVLAESDGTEGYMWECPDFFEIGGKHVLLFSPQGIEEEGEKYQNLFQTGYIVGDFNYETLEFSRGEFKELDYGHDFYAVQTFLDDHGRRIAIGWMDMWESPMPTKEHGWAGALTLPRELFLTPDGNMAMNPVSELKMLREKSIDLSIDKLDSESIDTGVKEDLLEIKVDFSLKDVTADEFGLKLRCNEEGTEETVVGFDVTSSKLFIDREKSGKGVSGVRKSKVELKSDTLSLHLYLDRSSVEVFANDGLNVMTSRIYPQTSSLGLQFYAKNGVVQIEDLNVWKLKDIWKESE